MLPRVRKVAAVLRTALKRRGPRYAAHLVKEHAVPRAMYATLLGPSQSAIAARAVETAFAARDLATVESVLRVARERHRQQTNTDRAVTGTPTGRARTDDFAHEWLALELLRDTGVAPTVLRADEARRAFDLETIEGTPLNAPLSRDVSRGVERALDGLHRAAIVGVRYALDWARLTPEGGVRFAALPGVRVVRGRGIRFQVERDRDRVAANERFGMDLLTETGVRQLLGDVRRQLPSEWARAYAPIDFGAGVSVGRFPMTDSGTGRWDVFNRHVVAPIVRGRRVLDLGSNNGSLPLMMLRAGAAEVIAVERSPQLAEAARVNARVFEWRDMRAYNLRVHVGDMRDALAEPWGSFDVVTAFCSLYYLPEEDMAAIIRWAAEMGATLILQSNEGADNIPASRAARLKTLMEQHGYAAVEVHAFDGFARPILVGTPARLPQQTFA